MPRLFLSLCLFLFIAACDSGTDGPSVTGSWQAEDSIIIVEPGQPSSTGTLTRTFTLTQSGRTVSGTYLATTRNSDGTVRGQPTPLAVTGTADGSAVALSYAVGSGGTVAYRGTFDTASLRLVPADAPQGEPPMVFQRR